MTENGDRALLLALPLPLAQAWRRTLYADAPLEVHDRALLTLEAVLKYLASIAAANWVATGAASDAPRKACEALVRPSLGHWAEILRTCRPALNEDDVIRRWLDRVHEQPVTETCDGLPGRTVEKILQAVPAFRNTIAHGAGLSPETAAESRSGILALTRTLLTALVGNKAPVLTGIAGARRVRLTGGVTLEPGTPDHVSGTVLVRTEGRSVVLSPLWIYDAAWEDVLVLNKGAGLRKVEYLSYGLPHGRTGLTVRKGQVAERATQFLETATGRGAVDADVVADLVEETEVKELAGRATEQRIGPYRIVRQVAKGGQSVVYEAIQEDPPRRVALKVLPLHAAVDDEARRRFREEGEALAKIEHSGVVPVYATGEHEGVPWIAMKFVEGKTLAEVLKAFQGHAGAVTLLDWNRAASSATDRPDGEAKRSHAERIAEIGRDAARALQACHERGIVHRDVKPGNIMLDDEGRVLLTDFGLARTSVARSRTLTRKFVGTLQYAAPESMLAASRKGLDARVDVYGLGATMYEAVALRRPFQEYEADDGALLQAVQVKEPPGLRRTAPWVPRDFATIMEKAIEKDPDRRYQSAGELADDLERFLRGEPINARPAGPICLAWKWARRHPARAIAILALCALLLGAVAVSVYATHQSNRRQRLLEQKDVAFHEKSKALEREKAANKAKQDALTRSEAMRLVLQSKAFLSANPGLSMLLALESAKHVTGCDVNTALVQALDACRERWTLTGHGGPILGVAFDRNEKWLLSWSEDKTARLWNIATGAEQHLLQHADTITQAQFSQGGDSILTVAGGRVHVWNADYGTRSSCFGEYVVAVSPDGYRFVDSESLRDSRTNTKLYSLPHRPIQIIDMSSGAITTESRAASPEYCAFSPDGSRLAMFAENRLYVVDASNGELLTFHDVKKWGDRPLTWSLDSKVLIAKGCTPVKGEANRVESLTLICRGVDGAVVSKLDFQPRCISSSGTCFELTRSNESGYALKPHYPDSPASKDPVFPIVGIIPDRIVLNPSATRIIGQYRDRCRLAIINTEGHVQWLGGHDQPVTTAKFSPSGRWIASGSSDRTVRLWGEKVRIPPRLWSYSPASRLGRSGKILATAYPALSREEKKPMWLVVTYDVLSGARRFTRRASQNFENIRSLDLDPSGAKIVVLMRDTLRVLDISENRDICSASLPWPANRVAFSSNGTKIIAWSTSNDALITYDLSSLKLTTSFTARQDIGRILGISPNLRTAVTSSEEAGGRIWDLVTGDKLMNFEYDIKTCAFSGDSRRVAMITMSVAGRLSLRVADARSGEHRGIWALPWAPERQQAFISGIRSPDDSRKRFFLSPAGSLLAIVVEDECFVWDTVTGEEIGVFRGTGPIESVALSSDDKVLSISTSHRTVLWRPRANKKIVELPGTRATISADAKFVATHIEEGYPVRIYCRVWPLDLVKLAERRRPRALTRAERREYNVWDATDQRAADLVDHLFKRFPLAQDVIAAIDRDCDLDEMLRKRAVLFARERWNPPAEDLLAATCQTAMQSNQGQTVYSAALRKAKAARRLLRADSTEGLDTIGALHYRLQRYSLAADALRRSTKDDAGIFNMSFLVMAYHHLGERAKTREAARRLGKLCKEDIDASGPWVSVFSMPEGLEVLQCESILREVLATLDPKLTSSLKKTLETFSSRRRQKQTSNDLNQELWNVVTTASLGQEAYRAALDKAKSACQQIPSSGRLLFTLGAALYRVGNYDEAAKVLKQSYRLNLSEEEDLVCGLAFLAMVLHKLGEDEKAKECLRKMKAARASRPLPVNDGHVIREAERALSDPPR